MPSSSSGSNSIGSDVDVLGYSDEEIESTKEKAKEEYPKYTDMGGIKDIKNEMEMFLFPFKRRAPPRLGLDPVPSLLLYGPSGCGKTMFVSCVANTEQQPFYTFSISGATPLKIRMVFNKALDTAPSFVFIDDLNSLTREQGLTLKSCIGKSRKRVEKYEPYVFLIAATNKYELLNPTDTSLFIKKMFLGHPDENQRVEIASVILRRLKAENTVDAPTVAAATDGLTPKEIEAWIKKLLRGED